MRIGSFEIIQVNEDYYEVRRHCSIVGQYKRSYISVKICGGDLETVLGCVFVSTESYPLREVKNDEQT